MMKLYSVSLHNGTKWSRQHNIRGAGLAEKEEHINPEGYHKAFIDKTLQESYRETFGQAVLDYNAKQKRSERMIVDYLSKVKDEHKRNPNKRPHASYEMIVTIGNRDHHPSFRRAESVLKAWLDEFQKQNPNLVVFGAYFHADEPGSAPHMHVDYYLVKRENKRGLSLQVSQNGGLTEQGYYAKKENGKFVTPQTQWQDDSRELLRRIAQERGMFVEESKSGQSRKHLDTDLFKKKTTLDKLNNEVKEVSHDLKGLKRKAEVTKQRLEREEKRVKELEDEIAQKEEVLGGIDRLEFENQILKRKNRELEGKLTLMKRAFNGIKDFLKTLALEGESLWSKAKSNLFLYLGKKDYDDWQYIRHEEEARREMLAQQTARRQGSGFDYDR